MEKKPQDLLEFLRRSSPEDPAPGMRPEPAPPSLEPTPRMLVLRRSQLIVAGVATALAVVLAFLLGLALGGAGEGEPAVAGALAGPWVIRVVTYKDTEAGRKMAKSVQAQLERLLLREVSQQYIPSQEKVVVTIGAWVHPPERFAPARELRRKIRGLSDSRTEKSPFQDADFWRIRR